MRALRNSLLLLIVTCAAHGAAAESALDKWSAGQKIRWKLHAEGAQLYECKVAQSGGLAWQFREPVATLIEGGTTVGTHSAGPQWQVRGTIVTAKVAEQQPGPTPADIAELKLAVTNSSTSGLATVLRVNTKGGQLQGACETAGGLRAIPYSAEYLFLDN